MSAGLGTRPSVVAFDVEDLVTRVWSGSIRVPRFQRDFRWTQHDVAQLFDSIAKGYPVGSLLFWVRPAPAQKIRLGNLSVEVPAVDDALWVVDGRQRIISLANALHPSRKTDPRFALAYDLGKAEFVSRTTTENGETIPLPVLFDLQLLVRWFSDHPEIIDQLNRATAPAKAIRQFEIPAYLVEGDDSTVLPVMCDRMDRAGQPLRALGRSRTFVEIHEINQGTRFTVDVIAEEVDAERDFGQLDGETVLKAILARRNPGVPRGIHNEFDPTWRDASDFPGESRDEAFEAGRDALVRAIIFLQESAGVPHLAFLSHRYLLVTLTRMFAHHPDLDPRNTQLLRRWYWRATMIKLDPFPGSSDIAARAMCSQVRPGDASRSVQNLLTSVGRTGGTLPDVDEFDSDLSSRKIILCALWDRQPRSPISGRPYDRAALAEALDGRSTAGEIFPYIISYQDPLEEKRRWAANRILLPEEEIPAGQIATVFTGDAPEPGDEAWWPDVLSSHCMTREIVQLLARGDTTGFLVARQEVIRSHLHTFLERMCEWGFEDTPPLQALVMDDSDDEDTGEEGEEDEPR